MSASTLLSVPIFSDDLIAPCSSEPPIKGDVWEKD